MYLSEEDMMNTMRARTAVALTALAVVSTILAGSTAGASTKPRTEVVPYSRVGEVEVDSWTARCGDTNFNLFGGALGTGNGWETALFSPASGERSVAIKIVDAVPGQRVMAFVQYADPSGAPSTIVVCGSTIEPISIDTDQSSVSVWVLEGFSDRGPSIPTSGRVVATFYR
jgi:hypothetical protein